MVVVFSFKAAFFAAVDVVPRTVSLHKDNEFLKRIRKPRVVDALPAGDIPAFRTTFGNEHGASSKVELVNAIHFSIIVYRHSSRNSSLSNEKIESKRFDPLILFLPKCRFSRFSSALLKRAAGYIDCHESSYSA